MSEEVPKVSPELDARITAKAQADLAYWKEKATDAEKAKIADLNWRIVAEKQ